METRAGRPRRPLVHARQRRDLPAGTSPRRSRFRASRHCGQTSITRARSSSSRCRRRLRLPTEHERTAVLDRAARGSRRRPRHAAAATPPPPRSRPRSSSRRIAKSIPEFLELFIEEAKDEIAKLEKLFPLWDENPQDQDSLVNMRRSFHTLKGSGRMVGAQLIGEFAWSVENLLNRVINKTLDRTPDMMTLLREAVAAVPQLVEQLETGRAPAGRYRAASSAQANTMAGVRRAPGSARRARQRRRLDRRVLSRRRPSPLRSRKKNSPPTQRTHSDAGDGSGAARNLRQGDRGPSRGHP